MLWPMFNSAISGRAADPPAGPGYAAGGASLEHIVVTVNKSRTVNVGRPFTRAIVGSTDFADVLPLNDRSVYIQAKKVGSTNVSLIDGPEPRPGSGPSRALHSQPSSIAFVR